LFPLLVFASLVACSFSSILIVSLPSFLVFRCQMGRSSYSDGDLHCFVASWSSLLIFSCGYINSMEASYGEFGYSQGYGMITSPKSSCMILCCLHIVHMLVQHVKYPCCICAWFVKSRGSDASRTCVFVFKYIFIICTCLGGAPSSFCKSKYLIIISYAIAKSCVVIKHQKGGD
jgi:hypothetical protein